MPSRPAGSAGDTSHLVMATAAEAYLAELVNRVRPLAVKGDAAADLVA